MIDSPIIDSHCHLDDWPDDQRAAVVARARVAGVASMVTIGTRPAQSAGLPDIAAALDVWCTVGVHPQYVAENPVATTEQIVALTQRPRVVGIGESGLDYHYETSPRDQQQASFRNHIRAAQQTGLPLVIHARDADRDVADILRQEYEGGGPFGMVLHCFSSGRGLMEAAVALGAYVSLSGILTFPKSTENRAIAADVPGDRLLLETDAPYLSPVPFRGKRNEPANVVHTAAALADVRGLTTPALAALTTDNFYRLFTACA